MAEACRLGNHNLECKPNHSNNQQDENFCIINVLCVFISFVTILADLTTDLIVFAEYCKDGHLYWALGTMIFILSPNILMNIFSMRWFVTDHNANLHQWITHICLVGLLKRYIIFLHKVFVCKNWEAIKAQKLLSQRNDLSLLHFLYIFTGTVPQIILQTYAIITLDDNYYTKVFSLTASVSSVVWGFTSYIYSITAFSEENHKWKSVWLKLVWHFGILMGRISGILLFTVISGIWTLLPLGLHWSAMTLWIVVQKTTFCPNKVEETMYNVVMGFVYCFCYINLREGHTRYRLILFYTLITLQNFGSLIVYTLLYDGDRQKKVWSIAATTCIILGTIIGIFSMIFYYRFFHWKGPILWKTSHSDIELNNKAVKNNLTTNKIIDSNSLHRVRTFKGSNTNQNADCNPNEQIPTNETQKKEADNADKILLLDHWIARSGTPTFTSAPVGNISLDVASIDVYTVQNTPQPVSTSQEDIPKYYKSNRIYSKNNKKVIICSPTELNLKLSSVENLESSIDELTSSNLNLYKRRGICSSDELSENLTNLNLDMSNIVNGDFMKSIKNDQSSEISHETDGSNKKTSSDSINMDLDLSFSDINSSDINTFNENIVQKLCLSALKNIKVGNQDADIENIQRIALDILKEMYAKKGRTKNALTAEIFSSKQRDLDTPTEILSVHDYENICAVNIAREAWGLRSWNGYCDIENWMHDGSVFRDRRRDTLTSASTEISSCISQDLKNAILSAPSFPKKAHTYSNVFVKFEKTNQEDYASTLICQDDTFLAKPCVIDMCKDPIHLEPIMEELDDLGDIDTISKKRLNSESSLVATIDEIRKSNVSNSPRNLYHRREHLWDSPQLNSPTKIDTNLTKALWKEPSKFDSSNIMNSHLPEKENIKRVSRSMFGTNIKDISSIETSMPLDFNQTENLVTQNKNTKRRHKLNTTSLKAQSKTNNSKPEQSHQDLSNKDIDFLWQLVSENTRQFCSAEDCASNRMSSSLQSLIQKDPPNKPLSLINSSTSKLSNIKKQVRSKPRRKFSILRERFEPKILLNSDEEILYQSSESTSQPHDGNIINVVNQFDTHVDGRKDVTQNQSYHNLSTTDFNSLPAAASHSIITKDVKDKRNHFMKQVLSPPKFNTKLKHKVYN